MRVQGTYYRALHPKWSFAPVSGRGAAIIGGRSNPLGTPALYLSSDFNTAVQESQRTVRELRIDRADRVADLLDDDRGEPLGRLIQ